ncbi:MAG: COX15/CtaA family protein [Solirubrobacterales bacterium]|nr:COX15/CtaA family protein [Solirubrobacterales bacterium]
MTSVKSESSSVDLTRFRQLTAVTAIATFVLIVIGGVVRVSDSGLGCGPAGSGTHGWPLCTGKVIPLVGGSTMVEFTHRLVAGLVAVLSLVLLQVLLGALNVWMGKHAGLIVGHLTLGTLVWAVVFWAGLTYVQIPERERSATLAPAPA